MILLKSVELKTEGDQTRLVQRPSTQFWCFRYLCWWWLSAKGKIAKIKRIRALWTLCCSGSEPVFPHLGTHVLPWKLCGQQGVKMMQLPLFPWKPALVRAWTGDLKKKNNNCFLPSTSFFLLINYKYFVQICHQGQGRHPSSLLEYGDISPYLAPLLTGVL